MPPPVIEFFPEWKQAPEPLRHTWEGVVNIDQFRWMVRRDTQEALAAAVAELGARHVRAVGMLCDEMRFFSSPPSDWASRSKANQFNFQIIDYVMDSLCDLGISPMFTTTFTPSAWARGGLTTFSTKSRVGPPVDHRVWANAVSEAVRHAVWRYGLECVRGWYFEVWNEPNLAGFFDGSREEFFELWRITFDAIKSVDSELRVGGPSTARAEWLPEFLEWTSAHRCPPDYLITHIYNNDSESGALSPFDGPQEDRTNTSPHFASRVIRGTRLLAREMGFAGEIHWNEWGRTWHPTDPARESANEAAWLVMTMAEVSQEADQFAYWCLSDIYDQVGYTRQAFEGHYGMMSLQGLRKPSWIAHQLLGKLGASRIPCRLDLTETECTGAIATQSSECSQILVFSHDPGTEVTLPHKHRLRVGVPEHTTQCRITRLDSSHNNAPARWKSLGSPDYLSRQETDLLRSQDALQSEISTALERTPSGTEIVLEAEFPGLLLIETGAPLSCEV